MTGVGIGVTAVGFGVALGDNNFCPTRKKAAIPKIKINAK
jgi:hypothetical protein